MQGKARDLVYIVAVDSFQNSRAYERPARGLYGTYTRRINIQHRLVYELFKRERTVRVLRMWSLCQ